MKNIYGGIFCKDSYIIGFLIVAAFVYELKENEDLEETKPALAV